MNRVRPGARHSPDDPLPGATGTVDLWWIAVPTDASLEAYETCLDEHETAQAERRARRGHHREYVVAHGLLRRVLGARLGRAPASLRFVAGRFGKPALVDLPGLEFNLSHAEGLVVVAVGSGHPVGVDVENTERRLDWRPLARRYFSGAEVEALHAMTDEPRAREAFFACWTRKEALVKARGDGIQAGLDSFDVSVEPGTASLNATRGDGWAPGPWSLTDLDLPPPYRACLALAGPLPTVRYLHPA